MDKKIFFLSQKDPEGLWISEYLSLRNCSFVQIFQKSQIKQMEQSTTQTSKP